MRLPIYLDHAATTPVDPAVLTAMTPYFSEVFGNPSSLYSVGQAAREAVEKSREIVARSLNASEDEIVFLSGGTEADNTAVHGVAETLRSRGRHILTTPIEHHAILEPAGILARNGYDIEFIPVNKNGSVELSEVASRLRSDTILVSVMHGNNEVGTLQPVAAIGALCRSHGVVFHTDAVQTFGKVPIDVRAMSIDLLSLSAHKLYGPKGVGALYIRRGTPLARFQSGGGQERGRRAGTSNVPGIVGLGEATRLAVQNMEAEAKRLTELRERFFEALPKQIPGVHITGNREERLPLNIHFCVEGVQGEPLLLALDEAGICVSAGSACSAGSTEPSHVLTAIGVPRQLSSGALRLTMGQSTTWEALEYTLQTLSCVTADLRRLGGSRFVG